MNSEDPVRLLKPVSGILFPSHDAECRKDDGEGDDCEDQFHGVDVLFLKQPVECENKSQWQNVRKNRVKDPLD